MLLKILMYAFTFVIAFVIIAIATIIAYKPKKTKRKSFKTSFSNTLKGLTPASNNDFLVFEEKKHFK